MDPPADANGPPRGLQREIVSKPFAEVEQGLIEAGSPQSEKNVGRRAGSGDAWAGDAAAEWVGMAAAVSAAHDASSEAAADLVAV